MNKLDSFSTEELLQELMRRRRAYIDQLDAVLTVFRPDGGNGGGRSGQGAKGKTNGAAAKKSAPQPVAKGAAKRGAPARKQAGGKRAAAAPTKKESSGGGRVGRRPRAGKGLDIFILDAMKSEGRPLKPKDLLPLVSKAGWKTESSDPVGVIKTYLNRMSRSGRHPVRALGGNTFEIKRGG